MRGVAVSDVSGVVVDATDGDLRRLGGKGASIGRLIAAGLPVPPTAVITTDAYRRFVETAGLAPLLARIRATPGGVPAAEVDAAFLAAPIADDLAAAVLGGSRQLLTGGGALALRSSASAEDTAERSFAGQYRSFLDVASDDEVLRAVRLVWASLWHPAPCTYRRAWGIPEDDVAMAVVLMVMVPAELAGVAFTVDPGGRTDDVRIEAVNGPGEGLVSGNRTPDICFVSRSHPDAPPGSPPVVAVVARLALTVEALFGLPEDVEWVWDGTDVWIVQARPITTEGRSGDGADTAVDDRELTTAGIAEMLPGVLPPLVWDLAGFAVDEALRRVFDDVGALPTDLTRPYALVRRVRGRAAIDLDVLKAVAAGAPGGSAADLERQYFGPGQADSTDEAAGLLQRPEPRRRALRTMVRSGRVVLARRRGINEGELVVAAIDAVVASPPVLGQLTDGQLLAYRGRLVDLGVRATAAELAVAAGAAAAYRQVELFLVPHLGEVVAGHETQLLTAGAGTLGGAEPGASRSVFAGPRWDEGHTVPDTGPSRAAPDRIGPDRLAARADLEARLQSSPRWRRIRILTGQVVDVRIHLLRRLVEDAVDALDRRERTKAAVLRLGGEVRRVHLEAGRRLVVAGRLHRAEDVDLLRSGELAGALGDEAPPAAELDRRARVLNRYAGEAPLPERFVGRPAHVAAVSPSGRTLTGVAASPGTYTGRALVLDNPFDVEIEPGDVIVARATDAAWSPLFIHAGAVVVERGGPLAHAAIVARELALPAVLNVAGAASVLNGRIVTVDGDRGVVFIHDTDDTEADDVSG